MASPARRRIGNRDSPFVRPSTANCGRTQNYGAPAVANWSSTTNDSWPPEPTRFPPYAHACHGAQTAMCNYSNLRSETVLKAAHARRTLQDQGWSDPTWSMLLDSR